MPTRPLPTAWRRFHETRTEDETAPELAVLCRSAAANSATADSAESAIGTHRPAALASRYVIDPALGLSVQFRRYARQLLYDRAA